jgi:hypothetical protein
MNEAKSNESQNMLTQKWALLAVAWSAPVFLFFAVLGDAGRGRAAAGFTAIMLMAVRGFWKMKSYAWFWMTIAVLIALHTLLVFLVPWPSGTFPGLTLLPIVVLDYGIVYGCIKLVEKLMNRRPEPVP